MNEHVETEIKINNTELLVKEYKGQRVVTFRDIDTVHGRPDGTADRNFRDNKDKFIKNEDYFYLSKSQNNEIRGLEIPNRGITIVTESGYLMLVKSFTDNLAWDVQRQLVKSYFRDKAIENGSCKPVDIVANDKSSNTAETLNNPNALDFHGSPVITTSELAKHYETSCQNVLGIFYRYKEHFDKGIHYFLLEVDEEMEFRKMNGLNTATKLYLWTRKGSLMFTKTINNDIGWEQYKKILDILFQRAYGDDAENNHKDTVAGTDCMQQPLAICEKQLKPQSNWYLKNAYKIERICKALDIEIKEFNHLVLAKIQEKYDMTYIGKTYKDKNGSTPEYALDIINHFPELSEIADNVLYEFMLSIIDRFSLVKDISFAK